MKILHGPKAPFRLKYAVAHECSVTMEDVQHDKMHSELFHSVTDQSRLDRSPDTSSTMTDGVLRESVGLRGQIHVIDPQLEPVYWRWCPSELQRSHLSSSRGSQWPLSNGRSASLLQLEAALSKDCNATCFAFTFCKTRLTGESQGLFPFLKMQRIFLGQGEKMLTGNFHLAATIQSSQKSIKLSHWELYL